VPTRASSLAALALVLALSQGVAPAAWAKPSTPSVLRVASYGDVPTLDPAQWDDATSEIYIDAIYDTLVRTDGTGRRILPDLAVRWRSTDGGRRWVFWLRHGVRFSNGDPLTAPDVVADVRRLTAAATHSPYASAYRMIAGYASWHAGRAPTLAGVVASGDTVVFRLAYPAPDFLKVLALPAAAIVDPAAAAREGPHLSDHPVGTGPYELARWDHGHLLVLRRNPLYWGAPPAIAQVVTTIGLDPSQQLRLFGEGRLDLAPVVSTDYLRVLADPRLLAAYRRRPGASIWFYGFNTTLYPFNHPAARLAVNLAIDRARLLAAGTLGRGRPVNDGLFVPGMPGYDPRARRQYPYDPPRAKQLLASLGIGPRHPVTVTLALWPDPDQLTMAALVAADLAPLGLKVRLDVIQGPNYFTLLTRPDNGINLFAYDWLADDMDPRDFFDNLFGREAIGSTNATFWTDPVYQRLVDEADRLPAREAARRLALYAAANRRLLAEAPWVPLYYGWNDLVVSPRVKAPSPDDLGLGPVEPIQFADLRLEN
jgi:ABC-type transport system substrate-binding protein